MKISEVYPNIFEILSPDFHTLAYTFLRVQEFSEGKIFFNEIFEISDYEEKWCHLFKEEQFTYVNKWNGYNISGKNYFKWNKQVVEKSKRTELEEELYERLEELELEELEELVLYD